jgi:hypothetical protein
MKIGLCESGSFQYNCLSVCPENSGLTDMKKNIKTIVKEMIRGEERGIIIN